jgi:LysR family transcriptional regulator, glycine cleavage system transcriptional activator
VVDHIISDRTQDSWISPIDLRIRYGSGQFQDEDCTKLFDDHIVAVASPAYLQGRSLETLHDIPGSNLLSVEGVDWSWTTWADFLRHGAVPAKRLNIRRFNSYVIAIQAALDGQGVALGWKSLVTPLIADRRLQVIGAHEMPAPQSFYLTWTTRRLLSTEAAILKSWLLNNLA